MKQKILFIGLTTMVFMGCIEEITITTELQSSISAEAILVVEATITDEFRQQEVLLSRGSSFANDSTSIVESNAQVMVIDLIGTNHAFFEQTPGTYLSTTPFAAELGREYLLQISTSDGKTYESEVTRMVGTSVMDAIYAERTISNNDMDGVAVFVNGPSDENQGNYLRFSYEETYKIIAPNWGPFEFIVSDDGTSFSVGVREQEERVCYNTVQSNEIIQTNTIGLDSGRLERFQVRFLGNDNFAISHRYSIKVRQEVLSREAYEFYEILDSFSSVETVFSEVQPGAIEGNVKSMNGEDTVIGLFSVVSVTEERLFFNYEDFFPNEPLPPYPITCRIYVPSTDGIEDILSGRSEYVGDNEDPGPDNLPYYVTQRACGDCTVLGNNVVPEFWTEG